MKNKKINLGILILIIISLISSCGTPKQELLKSPFIMEVHKTYMNGAYYHNYPEKIFNDDKLFDKLNSASGDKPFNVTQSVIEYIVDMQNGDDYSTFYIWNDGTVTLNYNILFDSTFYLTESEHAEVLKLLE